MIDDNLAPKYANISSIPSLSVIICTRNRGRKVVDTIESIFNNHYENFELIIMDQSTDSETKDAVDQFSNDPRFRYIPLNSKGVGLARNSGLRNAKTDIVVFTDDDCIALPDYLQIIDNTFQKYPDVAAVFCSVLPGEFDSSAGTIPNFKYKKDRLVKSFAGYIKSNPMCAGMGLRKSKVERWGGFDETMGTGSYFQGGEDTDLALRCLYNKDSIYELERGFVIHNGFRTFEQYRTVIARDMFGIGAAQAKFIKRFYGKIFLLMGYSTLFHCLWEPMIASIRAKKLMGVRRILYYLQGVTAGLMTPINNKSLTYRRKNGY